MKPALIAAVVLTLLIHFTPRGYSQQSAADAQEESGNKSSLSSDQVHSNTKAAPADKEPPHWYQSPEWILVIVGIVTAFVIGWQSWETKQAAEAAAGSVEAIKQQTAHIERQALSMRRQTTILRNNVNAVIASERAWVEAEVVPSNIRGLSVYRYALKIANLGKTPGQIRSYRISTGELNEGHPFDPNALSHRLTRNLHIFIGSGAEQVLEDDIDMDAMFSEMSNISAHTGAFCVSIEYADTVTGTPEERTERETSFVYLYIPLLHKLERLSQYNKYT